MGLFFCFLNSSCLLPIVLFTFPSQYPLEGARLGCGDGERRSALARTVYFCFWEEMALGFWARICIYTTFRRIDVLRVSHYITLIFA